MIDNKNTILEKIIIHKIGKKTENEGVKLSKKPAVLDDEINELLIKYFITPFKSEELFEFTHEEDLSQNTLFNLVSDIFENPNENFVEKSEKIAWHLYTMSSHQKINAGEMYLVYFNNIVIDEIETDAIGIFKSENKETFFKVFEKNSNLEVEQQTGISINKLEKGCLIFNEDEETGYKISIVDKLNKGNEAAYWIDDFLNVKPKTNNYSATKNYLEIVKGFSEHVLNEDNNVEIKDKIAFLQKSQQFFKEKEKFNEDNFRSDVIGNEVVINAFDDYKKSYLETESLPEITDNFEISKGAMSAHNKFFRSIIKLDTNFHIYVHSKPEYIEKGFDDSKKRKFYKLYFDSEK
jgi:hypothetical protein